MTGMESSDLAVLLAMHDMKDDEIAELCEQPSGWHIGALSG